MNRIAPALVCGAVLFASIPASGQRLCDGIAARLRADPSFTASGSHVMPLDVLTKQSFVEMATSPHAYDGAKDPSAYGMDKTLAGAIKEISGFEQDNIWSLKDSPVHAFTNMGGTAHCATFVFFADGHRLPDPPQSLYGGMSGDDASMVECYMSQGSLARAGGRIAFVVTDRHIPRNFDVDLRLATLDDARWGDTCKVHAEFETRYSVRQVFRSEGGPLTRGEILRIAPEIARARDRAKAAKTRFAFGAPLSKPAESRLQQLSKSHPPGIADKIPTFGAKIEQEYVDIGNDQDDLPVAIKGKPYLVRIAHPSIGWRDFDGYNLIFFRAEGDALVPVASASIDEDRGKATAIKAVALTP